MKTILKTIFFSALLVFAIGLHADCQTNAAIVQSAQDSLKKVQAENQRLYKTEFSINAALIDSAIKRIEGFVTMKDIKEQTDRYKYYESCSAFVNALFEMWLENRKKKGGK